MLGFTSVPFRRFCLALGAVVAFQAVAAAQERTFNDNEPNPGPKTRSGFRLFGDGDFAATGVRSGGVDWWVSNEGPTPAKSPGSVGDLPSVPEGAFLFELQLWMTAGKTDWARAINNIPSLENVKGGGYTARMSFQRWTPDHLWAYSGKDGSVGTLHSGVTSEQGTGSCLDNSTRVNGFLDPDVPLLAGSDCPPTWPNPEAGFEGERVVADTTWLRRFNENPAAFTFQDFKIPASERQAKNYGSFQTYGSVVDYGREAVQRFGPVVPGGSGEILLQGYPMGIEFAFDAFTYAVPALSQALFWKAKIINNSADVYGVGIDYDSLYIGVMPRPSFSTQAAGLYVEPSMGAVFMANPNSNSQNCYGGVHGANVVGGYTAGTNIRQCLSNTNGDRGTRRGAISAVILKSPIGDLRNKKFTDPESPFFFPAHPNAGDTITFNQANTCGFTCASDQFFAGNAQAAFGAYANIAKEALAGRGVTPGQLTELQYFDLFHNQDWPLRWSPNTGKQGDFNWYVPGGPETVDGSSTWDYDHDGIPDTLYVTSCWKQGCVPRYTDTLPGGFPNRVHNAIHMGFGPFKLAAGDTVEWVMAHTIDPDSITAERTVANIIATYQTFWLSAEPPAMPNVLSAAVTGGNRQFDTFIRMYLGDEINNQIDPFLLAQAEQLRNATDPASIALRVQNPSLINDIRAVALPRGTALVDTVPRTVADSASCTAATFTAAACLIQTATAIGVVDTIFVFKSCDNGLTFTNTTAFACTPAPARNLDGSQPGGFAWQAYALLSRNAQTGLFPTQYTDGGITGGLTYTYVFAARSYSGVFPILRPLAGGGVMQDSLVIRPAVANGLSTNTSNRNVAVVYVPASRQAGSVASTVRSLGTSMDTVAAYALSYRLAREVRGTAPIPHQIIFSDSAVIEVFDADTSTAAITSTTVRLFDLSTNGGTASAGPRGVVASKTYMINDPAFRVDPAGIYTVSTTYNTTGTTTSSTTTYAYRGSTTQATLVADGKPYWVNDSLSASQLTPDRTLARNDYPGLVVLYSAGTQRSINNGATRWVAPGIGVLSTNSNPNVAWRSAQSTARSDAAYTHYTVVFNGKEYGPGSPFTLDFANPQALQAAFDASINARPTASTTVADDSAAAALNRALGTTLTASDLATMTMPFTIVNGRTGQPVKIAVRKSLHPSTLLFGTSSDTLRVNAPADKWVPGDQLYFIETVRELRKNASGRDTIVLSGGVPDSVNINRVTWGPAMLGCDVPAGAFTCNPVTGRGGSGYTSTQANLKYEVVYYATLGDLLSVNLEVTPDIAGSQVAALTDGDLSLIGVAPNPYVMFSLYEQVNNVKRLMFTGLPSRGTLRIYTASVQFVQQLNWTDADLERNCTATVNTTACQSTGDLAWDMRTREDLEIGPGFYIFVVSTDVGGGKKEKLGKFVVIH
jgi:hypothetical protein